MKLRRGDFYHAGEQWMLHFTEKGGKSREIPVRHDLEQFLFAYLDAADLRNAPKDAPLFRSALGRTGQLSAMRLPVNDDGLPHDETSGSERPICPHASPHSFRVTTITDLLEQGVPLEDAQRLAGHAFRNFTNSRSPARQSS